MPLSGYLLYVGGSLLALLFVADACLPDRPPAQGGAAASATIRIHSDWRLPERVVLDTSEPTIVAAELSKVELVAPPGADVPQTRMREAFAEFGSADAERLQSRQSTRPEAKPQHQSKIARRHIERRVRLVARPPRYGWFGNQVW